MPELALLGGSPAHGGAWPRWPQWDASEAEALRGVLESGAWQSGPRVAAFEAAFARYQGAAEAVCATNGTATLEIALRALGVGPGDEVVVPAYTFAATALAVLSVGATPVFVDSEPETLNLDPAAVEAACSPRTVGVVPVHVGGRPMDLDRLLPLTARHGLFVLEDAAHAHGAEWRGRRVGALGTLGSFSFQTGKCMTCGDGGALVTGDPQLAARCRSIRSFGRSSDGRHELIAGNDRMTEFQAAVLACQLERLDAQTARRTANVARLRASLDGMPGVRVHLTDPRVTREPHYITLLHLDPDAFGAPKWAVLEALAAEGVPLEPGYAPLYREPVFERALRAGVGRRLECPIAEAASDRSALWVSFRLMLADDEGVDAVARALEKTHRNRAALSRWARGRTDHAAPPRV